MQSLPGRGDTGKYHRRGRWGSASRAVAACPMLVAAAILLSSQVGHAQSISAAALRQIQALAEEKAARTAAQRKVGSHLLYAAKQQRGEPIARGVASLRV